MAQSDTSLSVQTLMGRMRDEIMALHSDLLDVETCILKEYSGTADDSGKINQYETLQKLDVILQTLVGLDVSLGNICALDESLGEVCEDVVIRGINLESLVLRLSGHVTGEITALKSDRAGIELF